MGNTTTSIYKDYDLNEYLLTAHFQELVNFAYLLKQVTCWNSLEHFKPGWIAIRLF